MDKILSINSINIKLNYDDSYKIKGTRNLQKLDRILQANFIDTINNYIKQKINTINKSLKFEIIEFKNNKIELWVSTNNQNDKHFIANISDGLIFRDDLSEYSLSIGKHFKENDTYNKLIFNFFKPKNKNLISHIQDLLIKKSTSLNDELLNNLIIEDIKNLSSNKNKKHSSRKLNILTTSNRTYSLLDYSYSQIGESENFDVHYPSSERIYSLKKDIDSIINNFDIKSINVIINLIRINIYKQIKPILINYIDQQKELSYNLHSISSKTKIKHTILHLVKPENRKFIYPILLKYPNADLLILKQDMFLEFCNINNFNMDNYLDFELNNILKKFYLINLKTNVSDKNILKILKIKPDTLKVKYKFSQMINLNKGYDFSISNPFNLGCYKFYNSINDILDDNQKLLYSEILIYIFLGTQKQNLLINKENKKLIINTNEITSHITHFINSLLEFLKLNSIMKMIADKYNKPIELFNVSEVIYITRNVLNYPEDKNKRLLHSINQIEAELSTFLYVNLNEKSECNENILTLCIEINKLLRDYLTKNQSIDIRVFNKFHDVLTEYVQKYYVEIDRKSFTESEKGFYSDKKIVDDAIFVNKCRINQLTTQHELDNEHKVMHHCVNRYYGRNFYGKFTYSLIEDNNTRSTLYLTTRRTKSKVIFYKSQHYYANNVDVNQESSIIANEFIKLLDNDKKINKKYLDYIKQCENIKNLSDENLIRIKVNTKEELLNEMLINFNNFLKNF